MNKWELNYSKTLEKIKNNIILFAKMILFYYKAIIINKENDYSFLKSQYNLSDDYKFFQEQILEKKNIAIFTIFNNIPDCFHPLTKDIYYDYGCYISFIDPLFFNYSENNIIVKDNNIYNMDSFTRPIVNQDVAPYNENKRYIYINIKFFDFDKYKDYLLICIDKNKDMYIIQNSIVKKKRGKYYETINTRPDNFVYINVLRKINRTDILNVFDFYTIKKNTLLYSYHNKETHKEIYWFSLLENELLNDPYRIYYKDSDDLYKYTYITKNSIQCLNLSIDTFSKPEENLNYIRSKKNDDAIWNDNRGKRLLNEIIFKSSNIIILSYYYFDFLSKYGIKEIVNSYGYYEKLNQIYSYEVGFQSNPNKYVKFKSIDKIKIINVIK